jgi:hypothetical protein
VTVTKLAIVERVQPDTNIAGVRVADVRAMAIRIESALAHEGLADRIVRVEPVALLACRLATFAICSCLGLGLDTHALSAFRGAALMLLGGDRTVRRDARKPRRDLDDVGEILARVESLKHGDEIDHRSAALIAAAVMTPLPRALPEVDHCRATLRRVTANRTFGQPDAATETTPGAERAQAVGFDDRLAAEASANLVEVVSSASRNTVQLPASRRDFLRV